MSSSARSSRAGDDSSIAAWLHAIPAEWAPRARMLSQTPQRAGDAAGIYVSAYVGNRNVLAIDKKDQYQLVRYKDERLSFDAPPDIHLVGSDTGRIEYSKGFITLEPDRRTSLGYQFLVVENGTSRLLMDVDRFQNIGACVQWNGCLGRTDYFYRRMRSDENPIDSAGTDGPKAPPWSALPAALRAWTFETPVYAIITELLSNRRPTDDRDMIVRVDKGSVDRFRINMPLCSNAEDRHVHGWILDVDEHNSTFRVDLARLRSLGGSKSVIVGTRLSTSGLSCPGRLERQKT
jgi:hypothetical protein